ncbi:hypothetical protein HGRIS_000694 [Hohenbuehelia grisea]|uniref:Uncharacterized protein n=1 Tax=Hohenbuehelia grisea TaxID=104357 RepID=A0ABR3JSD5_9AGAR
MPPCAVWGMYNNAVKPWSNHPFGLPKLMRSMRMHLFSIFGCHCQEGSHRKSPPASLTHTYQLWLTMDTEGDDVFTTSLGQHPPPSRLHMSEQHLLANVSIECSARRRYAGSNIRPRVRECDLYMMFSTILGQALNGLRGNIVTLMGPQEGVIADVDVAAATLDEYPDDQPQDQGKGKDREDAMGDMELGDDDVDDLVPSDIARLLDFSYGDLGPLDTNPLGRPVPETPSKHGGYQPPEESTRRDPASDGLGDSFLAHTKYRSERIADFARRRIVLDPALQRILNDRLDLLVEIKRHRLLERGRVDISRKLTKAMSQVYSQAAHAFAEDPTINVLGLIAAVGTRWIYREVHRDAAVLPNVTVGPPWDDLQYQDSERSSDGSSPRTQPDSSEESALQTQPSSPPGAFCMDTDFDPWAIPEEDELEGTTPGPSTSGPSGPETPKRKNPLVVPRTPTRQVSQNSPPGPHEFMPYPMDFCDGYMHDETFEFIRRRLEIMDQDWERRFNPLYSPNPNSQG